ncbi:MAG: UDP-N-acetylmuramyl pentapeptide phosphotransferase [Thermoanaerobacterales bacterium]|nr:hypothetical protein [Bacillota bacterium]MDI6907957.1 UDP-N-acetylmuramyl pentapeptide phosphotransferase [Thermoanaerobacterales bacterium]
MFIALFFILGFITALIILPMLKEMAAAAGFVRQNYQGRAIPLGVGLVFFLAPTLVFSVTYLLVDAARFRSDLMVFLLVTGGMALLGFIDDVFGSRATSGLKGHFGRLLRGELTTGALKALGGVVIAFLASVSTAPAREVIVNTLLIALAANTLNLLDLRPGRAGKAYLLAAGLLAVAGWGDPRLFFLATVTGCLLAYLPLDLRARAMMGDAGSNVLGVTLGLSAVWLLDLPTRGIIVLVLLGLHLLTERYSLSVIIERNRLLRFLDRLGRNREEFSRR